MADYFNTLDNSSVPMMITQEARTVAAQFASQQLSPQTAKRVYRNTLAVYTVNNYMKILGIATDLAASDSWNPAVRLVADIADLQVVNKGRLECRAISTLEPICHVPLEAQDERIGFLVVYLNEEQHEAELLGFIDRIEGTELGLSQLRSLSELPAYLAQIQSSQAVSDQVHLSQWLQGVFESGWQTVETILAPQMAFAWRNNEASTDTLVDRDQDSTYAVNRVKVLEFELGSALHQIALLVGVTLTSEAQMNIGIQLCPTGANAYLPGDVQVRLLDDLGTELGQAKATVAETIQLRFAGHYGEAFSIEVICEDQVMCETFVI